MATSNLPLVRTNRYFASGVEEEYDTVENYEYQIGAIKSKLKSLGWYEWNKYLPDVGNIFCCKETSIEFGGAEFTIEVNAIVYSGYYAGWIYDLEATVKIGFNEYELKIDEDFDKWNVIDDDWCDNPGLSKMQAKNIARKVQSVFESIESEAEKVFAKCCDKQLYVSARFSNGETEYEECAN